MTEWISVKERLPEQRGSYLCCCDFYLGGTYIAIRSFGTNLEEEDDYDFHGIHEAGFFDYSSEYGYFRSDNVTHWMPLPELPPQVE